MSSTAKLVATQPTPQQLTDYANALIVVNSYAYAVTNQQLPSLDYPPTNYANFVASFGPAKAHALDWSIDTFPSIVQLPSTIVNQAANLFNMEELMITTYLNMLISDPTNKQAKTDLATALSIVQSLIATQVKSISAIQSQLTKFSSEVADDAETLTQIAAEALSGVEDEEKQIQAINQTIATLNSEISTAQTLLTVSEIGMGASIFVGLVGAVICFIPGAQGVGTGVIVLGVAGETASIAGTVLENDRIQAMQGEISSEQQEISGRNQDIIQLQGVSAQFNELYNANLQAQNALTTVENMWTSLDSVINEVSKELTDSNNDVSAAQYQQALNDFNQAETAWNDVVTFAQALAGINYSWQDSNGNWHDYGTQNPKIDNGNVNQIPSAA